MCGVAVPTHTRSLVLCACCPACNKTEPLNDRQVRVEMTSMPVSQLSLPQLDTIKTQLEEEIQLLTGSMQQLKVVQLKLNESKESLAELKSENIGKSILVPLTGSMYVPGKLKHCDNVLVDIGTGYYVEKTTKEADDFYQRKLDYVSQNIEKMQKAMMEKHNFRESILSTMQMKVMALKGHKS